MHVLRVVRVLLLVLIVAVIVGAASSVLSARPDLQNAKRNVDTSWSALSGPLDQRYLLLADAEPEAAADPRTDPRARRRRRRRAHALARRSGARRGRRPGQGREQRRGPRPPARGDGRGLPAGAERSRRRRRRSSTFIGDGSRAGAVDFNKTVESYEHERRGPVRAVVASVLGDGTIPVLDTTDTTVSAS